MRSSRPERSISAWAPVAFCSAISGTSARSRPGCGNEREQRLRVQSLAARALRRCARPGRACPRSACRTARPRGRRSRRPCSPGSCRSASTIVGRQLAASSCAERISTIRPRGESISSPHSGRWGRWAGRSRSARSPRSGRAAGGRISSKPGRSGSLSIGRGRLHQRLPRSTPGLHASGRGRSARDAAHERHRRARASGPQGSSASRTSSGASSTTQGEGARRSRSAATASASAGSVDPGEAEAGAGDHAAASVARALEHGAQAGLDGWTRARPSRRPSAGASRWASHSARVVVTTSLQAALAPAARAPRGGLARSRRRSGRAPCPSPSSQRSVERCELQRAWASSAGGRGQRGRVVAAAPRAVAVARRQRVQAHGHLADRAERAVGAGEELGQVVAGHVLDHLAARSRDGAVGQRDRTPSTRSRRRRSGGAAGRSRPWPRRRRSWRRAGASGGSSASIWPALGERAPAGRPARTPASSDRGEVALVVLDDPVQLARGELAGSAARPRPSRTWCPPRGPHGAPASRPRAAPRPPPRRSRARACRSAAANVRTAPPARPASSGCCRYGPGHLAAQPRGGHHLAGVGQAVGVEGAAQLLERGEVGLVEHRRACSASCRRPRRARR